MRISILKYFSHFRYVRAFYNFRDRKFNYLDVKLNSLDDLVELIYSIGDEPKTADIEKYLKEGNEHYEVIKKERSLILPDYVDGGRYFCQTLFAVVKILKPKVVIETGVANGMSTSMILLALEDSGGVLHSFDINSETKKAHRPQVNWEWHQLDFRNPKSSLKRFFMARDIEVDLWIHDSDHSRYWQQFEFELAMKHLSARGVIVSDDINDSSAWHRKFSRNETVELRDNHKVFGVAVPYNALEIND
jgi:predicted O-methyltransferase YrrM